MDVKLGMVVVVRFIWNGLPEGYRYLVMNLESQVKTISYEDLSAKLMDEEKRIMRHEGRDGIDSADPNAIMAHLATGGAQG